MKYMDEAESAYIQAEQVFGDTKQLLLKSIAASLLEIASHDDAKQSRDSVSTLAIDYLLGKYATDYDLSIAAGIKYNEVKELAEDVKQTILDSIG